MANIVHMTICCQCFIIIFMKRSNQGELLTDIILKVFHVNGSLNLAGDSMTSEFGLSSARWKVLGAIAGSSRKLSVPDIAAKMGLSRQAVQRLVDEMNKGNLVNFAENPNHRRSKHVILTRKGEKTYDQITQKQIPWVNSLSESMSETDLKTTLRTLSYLGQVLIK